jgi:probable selenate reductase FAD-binding subunit
MVTVTAYWRPTSITEALELLERPDAVVLAGGTRLDADPSDEQVEVVDLQALHLGGIRAGEGDALRIGAMVTLQELADSPLAPDVVREAARREQPSTLRAQGTVGGCVATGRADSELLAALLVHEAVVEVEDRTVTEGMPLGQVLEELFLPAGQLVTAVTIRTGGTTAAARTARTPADRPVVAAYARSLEGVRRVALTGVAPTPVLVEPGDDLQPLGDFRGSAGYRRHLAEVLTARVLEEVE